VGRRLYLLFFLFSTVSSYAQLGGKRSFEFLQIPASARQAALGGVNVSLADQDVNFFFASPALVSDTLAGMASASYQFYLADVGQAAFAYAHKFRRIGTLSFGVQHLSYGTIQGYDPSGMPLGDFKSGETAWVVSKSHQVGHFRVGANLKLVFSNLAGYRASAVMVDLGGVFIHPQQDLRVGLLIRNLGTTLSEYTDTGDTSLPFDVQAGATFKPEHMPLRFSLTAYALTRKDVTYYDPASGDDEPGTLDKVLRRINFGAEILFHRNVNLLLGYNYLQHQELKLEEGGGGAGISLGFSARIKAFEFVFSRSGYVAGNGGYTLTLSSNVDRMLKRR
jgi:hypothetical protein